MSHQPVESIAAAEFAPPHCPWPACGQHRLAPGVSGRFARVGSYTRRAVPHIVARFECSSCGRGFSQQSFSCTYYLKRPDLIVPIAKGLHAGSSHRQIAKGRCAPSTVTRLTARLGRHSLLLLARANGELADIPEPVVVDHFETFELSQDLPFGIATAVGHRSWFVYGLDPAEHGRGGRITPIQRARLARRQARGSRGGYRASFHRILDVLAPLATTGCALPILTDAHESYDVASHFDATRFVHVVTPNPVRGPKGSPRTPQARLRDERMFPSDLLHGLLRHYCKHHARETIAFGRRLNALMERGFLTAVWRNFVKGRSERKPDPTTPAMMLGLADEPWEWTRVFSRRLFPARTTVPASWMEIYRRQWITPGIGRNQRHQLKHAF